MIHPSSLPDHVGWRQQLERVATLRLSSQVGGHQDGHTHSTSGRSQQRHTGAWSQMQKSQVSLRSPESQDLGRQQCGPMKTTRPEATSSSREDWVPGHILRGRARLDEVSVRGKMGHLTPPWISRAFLMRGCLEWYKDSSLGVSCTGGGDSCSEVQTRGRS